jgi:nucleotide-binding universal stress UspA family protein
MSTTAPPASGAPRRTEDGVTDGADPGRLVRMAPRRRTPWLVVEVDGSPEAHDALVWALREAARREATVVAVCVLPGIKPENGAAPPTTDLLHVLHSRLDDALLRAVTETGVRGRCSTAVLERPVLEALTAAVHGSDLVVVGVEGKRLLRPALPRLRPVRRGA